MAPTKRKTTPAIISAAEQGDVSTVRRIIEHVPSSVSLKSSLGNRAIHVASLHNHWKVAEFLLDHGAKIDERGSQGKTALHFAAYESSPEVVSLLLKRGARTDLLDDFGFTPKQAASMSSGRGIPAADKTFRLLEKADPTIDLRTAIESKDERKVAVALAANPKALNKEDKSVGFVALALARDANPSLIRLLLESGADPNIPLGGGRKGNPPLTINDDPQLAEMLLQFGADYNKPDVQGLTIMEKARQHGLKALEKVLRAHGAKIPKKKR